MRTCPARVRPCVRVSSPANACAAFVSERRKGCDASAGVAGPRDTPSKMSVTESLAERVIVEYWEISV